MDTKGTIKLYKSDTILLSDSNYYKYIFKKTEKIVCTVFYILDHTDKSHKDIVAASVLESGKRALDSVLRTLTCRWYTAYDELYVFLNSLITLESNIRVAQAVALLQEDIADILALEIDAVLRGLRQYLGYEKSSAPDLTSFNLETAPSPATNYTPRAHARTAREDARALPPQADQRTNMTDTPLGETLRVQAPITQGQYKGHHIERRRIIKDILASKRQSTIKDISEKMPNHSEKTIQRELITMITEGSVRKEGERRWTRYSLVPGM